MTRIWSNYQETFFNFVLNDSAYHSTTGSRHGIVEAVAGSGKSTSLEEAFRRLIRKSPRTRTKMVAFGKHNADALGARGLPASTLHSLGMASLNEGSQNNLKVENFKYGDMVGDMVKAQIKCDWKVRRVLQTEITNLLNFAQLTLTAPTADLLSGICDHYDINIEDQFFASAVNIVKRCMEKGADQYRDQGVISFNDMVWLPVHLGLACPKYDILFVDELQDLNRAQIELALMHLEPNSGRFIGVGDRRQCQPPGTMVRMADGSDKPIESLVNGDRVLTWDRHSQVWIKGAEIKVAHRAYRGALLTVTAQGESTQCTPNHKWMVRWADKPQERWVTYLMRQGTRFRVGQCQMFQKSDGGNNFGLAQRARTEQADAAWVLNVHQTKESAFVEEQVLSASFGIPQICFKKVSNNDFMTQEVISAVFDGLDAEQMLVRAEACLLQFGRDISYPLWQKDEQKRQGRTTIFITEACNLLPELMAIPLGKDKEAFVHTKATWVPVEVSTSRYEGLVYSLDVAKHHLYVADGLLTHNSIFGFSGADIYTYDRIEARLAPEILKMHLSYRCPKSHAELAQRLVPYFEVPETAAEGSIEHMDVERLANRIQAKEMIMCRTTAPLVQQCFAMVSQGIAATIRGRDIGSGLAAMVKKVASRPEYRFENFVHCMSHWSQLETVRLMARKDADTQILALNDKVDCLHAIHSWSQPRSEDAFKEAIQSLFSDKVSTVTLSTVHRAKGLEADHTYILQPEIMPHPMAMGRAWTMTQEFNCQYVAETRSKDVLTYVHDEKANEARAARAMGRRYASRV